MGSDLTSRHDVTISSLAIVAKTASVGPGSIVWANAEIRDGAAIGANCTLGRGVYVDRGVKIGDNSKIEDNALLYSPAELEDGVFVGPAAILTNDRHPRAINPDGTRKSGNQWRAQGVIVGRGASIGAGATIMAGVRIGEWALIGAGAVVVSDVDPYSLVVGVPAEHRSWVGKSGEALQVQVDHLVDPQSGDLYRLVDGQIREVR